jgi:hypothetical protein
MAVGRGNRYHNKAFQSYQQSGIQQKETPATGELMLSHAPSRHYSFNNRRSLNG